MRRRFRLELLLVALVCIGPVLGAYLFYYYGDLSALPTVPNDERLLVQPAVPLPPIDALTAEPARDDVSDATAARTGSAAWGPKWTLLYVRTTPCDAACREDLVRIAQVHIRLARDQSRVRRAYLGPDPRDVAGDPTLQAASIGAPSFGSLAAALESAGAPVAADGRLYVVDPHGNLVLSYPPHPEQEGLLEDLERLLEVSRIG